MLIININGSSNFDIPKVRIIDIKSNVSRTKRLNAYPDKKPWLFSLITTTYLHNKLVLV
ncbi:MAG: hypothetical protein ACJAWQ_002086 [Paraglaciecola sp.]|jgi:hypothetical protein